MPILPPVSGAPYDPVTVALDIARLKLNDYVIPGGEMFTNNQVYSQTATNAAWRMFQRDLTNKGYTRTKGKIIIENLPPVQSLDPASEVSLSWTGYNDTANLWPDLILPPDFFSPLYVCERQTGTNTPFSLPLQNCIDGLPQNPKQSFNGVWEWRQDAIRMPGAQSNVDLQIEYLQGLASFQTIGPVFWYNQPIPIVDCADVFACYIAYQISKPRGDMDADSLLQEGRDGVQLIFNRDVKAKQRVSTRRRAFSSDIYQNNY